jgi:hypothetical protein
LLTEQPAAVLARLTAQQRQTTKLGQNSPEHRKEGREGNKNLINRENELHTTQWHAFELLILFSCVAPMVQSGAQALEAPSASKGPKKKGKDRKLQGKAHEMHLGGGQ